MNKNIIKNQLTARFLKEESTPGIDVTKKAQKQSEKINKAAVKDMDKDLAGYEKAIEKTDKVTKMPTNKFNFNNDKEKVYHDEMEIMNGQEMIEYDRDPNQEFKDRAKEAIVGSSRMGNNPEWANVVPKQQGFTGPTFGKQLVQSIKNSNKKRNDAAYRIMSFGDDIETVPKNTKKMSQFSALAEGEMGAAGRNIEFNNPYGSPEEHAFNNQQKSSKTMEYKGYEIKLNDYSNGEGPVKYEFRNMNDYDESLGHGRSVKDCIEQIDYIIDDREDMMLPENKNNNKPQIKQGMKRLNFKKEFNGVGNALKMIPESYKVDNKVFEMTDGNESYKIRWEGTLSEGKATILTASNKTMVNEDMQKMKHLMGYKSEKTLGLVKGNARLNENAIFNDIYTKTKTLLEGEDIDSQTAPTNAWHEKVKGQAPEVKKRIEGSLPTDKKTEAPTPPTKDWHEDVKSQAPEVKKRIEGSVDAKIGMGLGDQSEGEGEWDQIDVPQAAPEGTVTKTTYAAAPKTGEWDKVSVPQAADAKKHKLSMSEGVTLGGVLYEPIVAKKKLK
jgi:hypothetical protein